MKSVFPSIWYCRSIIHSLIPLPPLTESMRMSHLQSDQKLEKKIPKKQTRWNIWQSYTTKHWSIRVRACMLCVLRTFILTNRVKSKEDFNLSVCAISEMKEEEKTNSNKKWAHRWKKENKIICQWHWSAVLQFFCSRERRKKVPFLELLRIEWNCFWKNT